MFVIPLFSILTAFAATANRMTRNKMCCSSDHHISAITNAKPPLAFPLFFKIYYKQAAKTLVC
jgi:hypothetical protein